MNIREWQKEIHELAKEKGWYDGTPRSPLEAHMLIVSEIAEATEEARKNMPPIYQDGDLWLVDDPEDFDPKEKPEGELIELADAVIRIMDYCESRGWDLEAAIESKHEYNKTRSYRHGGKKF